MQFDDVALFGRESREHALDVEYGVGPRGAVGAHGQVPVFEFDLHQSLLPSEVFTQQIEGDREQPGAQALAGVEVCAGAMELQEGLLDQITRVFSRWQSPFHHMQQKRRIPLEDFFERLRVA
jgi:hypothetical protein